MCTLIQECKRNFKKLQLKTFQKKSVAEFFNSPFNYVQWRQKIHPVVTWDSEPVNIERI